MLILNPLFGGQICEEMMVPDKNVQIFLKKFVAKSIMTR